jgi:radical SAM protein with 4Fe4S-binding SPASM domain
VDEWAKVFRQAKDLGATYLDISGGEPLLFKDIFALIWEAKRIGFYVSLNTTGFNFLRLQRELEAVALDKVCISLISLNKDLNDEARGGDGYRHAMAAIGCLKTSTIDLALHFILSRLNFNEVPEIIRFAHQAEAASLAFAYPEDDHVRRDILLSKDEIAYFLARVVPAADFAYQSFSSGRPPLPVFFKGDLISAKYSEGLYWLDQDEVLAACDKPNNFLLIYPDGSVYPCNGAEYAHSPLVGNVLDDRLVDIWCGRAMNEFRVHRMPFCRHCPIKRHIGVPINKLTIPPYTEDAVLRVPPNLAPSRPLRLSEVVKKP